MPLPPALRAERRGGGGGGVGGLVASDADGGPRPREARRLVLGLVRGRAEGLGSGLGLSLDSALE